MQLTRRLAGRLDQLARTLRVRARSLAPRRVVRRALSRATRPRNRWHGALQRRYRARRLNEFLAPNVSAGTLAFDLGANEGEWTAALRAIGARVVAVEPQADCVGALRARFADDPAVHIYRSAVGDAIGRGILFPATSSSEHASMSAEWRQAAIDHRGMAPDGWLEGTEVEVTTLDALIATEGVPDFCKIDVEGFEAEVLVGLSQPLERLAFEFHHEMSHVVKRCVERLTDLGRYRYRIFLAEWPDPIGGELAPAAVAPTVLALPHDSWGMVLAMRQSD